MIMVYAIEDPWPTLTQIANGNGPEHTQLKSNVSKHDMESRCKAFVNERPEHRNFASQVHGVRTSIQRFKLSVQPPSNWINNIDRYTRLPNRFALPPFFPSSSYSYPPRSSSDSSRSPHVLLLSPIQHSSQLVLRRWINSRPHKRHFIFFNRFLCVETELIKLWKGD